MAAHYKLNRRPGEHFDEYQRIHLGREWNKRVDSLDAKLSFRSFARDMGVSERAWRNEYYRGGGSRPVWNPKTRHYEYGYYDPAFAQEDAREKASQKGPRQKVTNRLRDEFVALVREKDRHRSLYDAMCILKEYHPNQYIPCLRTWYNHVAAADIGLDEDDLVYGRRHRRRRNPAHPAKTVLGRRQLDDRPPEAVVPKEPSAITLLERNHFDFRVFRVPFPSFRVLPLVVRPSAKRPEGGLVLVRTDLSVAAEPIQAVIVSGPRRITGRVNDQVRPVVIREERVAHADHIAGPDFHAVFIQHPKPHFPLKSQGPKAAEDRPQHL